MARRRAIALTLGVLGSSQAAAQGAPASPAEQVAYRNARDGTYLTAALTLPAGRGPFPGVVLMSIAGADPIVDRLTGLGYAVLIPVRRGFVAVEPLLQASYQDLAEDGAAAIAYLRARSEVDRAQTVLIGQGDDAPPALMAAIAAPDAIPLVLLGPPMFPGPETFRLEQHGTAERQGWRQQQLADLDRFVAAIAELVLTERQQYLREYRLEELIASSELQLPYNAAFPTGADQPHFFASPLWHDRLALDPEALLARVHSPVLVLVGAEDLDTPMDPFLAAVRRGLSRAATKDTSVCLLADRTRHSFSDYALDAIEVWLKARVGAAPPAPPGAPAAGCF